ncbi:MAG: monooxygenase [Paucimonas sp.]|nr:monooxygenase [Paucimonas sp.]
MKQLAVVIAGASVAGCAAAILMRRAGHKVTLVEQKAEIGAYKQLCTHFIQPSAVGLLASLVPHGLESLACKTHAVLATPAGIIDAGGYRHEQADHALNLPRRVLDPLLRAAAIQAGVHLCLGRKLVAACHAQGEWTVRVAGSSDEQSMKADLLVAADGHSSTLARLLDNPASHYPNERASFFVSCAGVAGIAGAGSLFINHGEEMAFLYPQPDGSALLSCYVLKERAAHWLAARHPQALLADWAAQVKYLPRIEPGMMRGPAYRYRDYPSLWRKPVHAGCAFIGDAALTLDPMSGVGCGFALQSASLLAQSLGTSESVDEALQGYGQAHSKLFAAHAKGIIADSRIGASAQANDKIQALIHSDPELQAKYLSLTGRLIQPIEFQRAVLNRLARFSTRGPGATVSTSTHHGSQP